MGANAMPICDPARSETPNTSGNSMRENRETSSAVCQQGRPAGEGRSRTTCMNADEESDRGVVPAKAPNKAGQPVAEGLEGRPRTKENAGQAYTHPTQSGKGVSQGLAGVREAARERKKEKFTALAHHLTVDLLKQSFQALQKRAAAGVDGVTWKEYEVGLEDRLNDLHSRVHRGAYRALPSRRVYIPKADGRQRPLGIAALEDKIVQLATVRILECIYEEDFLGFSYGFRPGRSQHDALDAVTVGIERKNVSWVLDADIRGFFDQLNHEWLMRFIEHRVADDRMLRLIRKWLKAGVLEEGQWQETEVGTPQGAVMTPRTQKITCAGGRNRRHRSRSRGPVQPSAGVRSWNRMSNRDGLLA
jgi:RNA-directed DNA polymerase